MFQILLQVEMWCTLSQPSAHCFPTTGSFCQVAIAPHPAFRTHTCTVHTLSSITWTLNSQVKNYPDDLLCTPFISDSKTWFVVELLQDWIKIGTFGLVCCWDEKFIGEETADADGAADADAECRCQCWYCDPSSSTLWSVSSSLGQSFLNFVPNK